MSQGVVIGCTRETVTESLGMSSFMEYRHGAHRVIGDPYGRSIG